MVKFFLASLFAFVLALNFSSSALAFSPLDTGSTDQMNLHVQDIVDGNFNQDTDGNSVNVIVGQVISVFFGLLATIFIILMVYAGYNWMTAADNEKKIGTAQTTIRAAIIGLIITLAAYIITYFVFLAIPGSA